MYLPHTFLCLHRKTFDNGSIVTLHLFLSSWKNTTIALLWPHTCVNFTENTTTALFLTLCLSSEKNIRQRPSCDPTPVFVRTEKHTTTALLWPHTCLCLHRKTHDNGPLVTPHLSLSSQENTRQRPSCDPTLVSVRTDSSRGRTAADYGGSQEERYVPASDQHGSVRLLRLPGLYFPPGSQHNDAYPQPPVGVAWRHWWRVRHPVGLQLRRQLLPVRHHGPCGQSGAVSDDEVWRRGERVQKAWWCVQCSMVQRSRLVKITTSRNLKGNRRKKKRKKDKHTREPANAPFHSSSQQRNDKPEYTPWSTNPFITSLTINNLLITNLSTNPCITSLTINNLLITNLSTKWTKSIQKNKLPITSLPINTLTTTTNLLNEHTLPTSQPTHHQQNNY